MVFNKGLFDISTATTNRAIKYEFVLIKIKLLKFICSFNKLIYIYMILDDNLSYYLIKFVFDISITWL